MAKPKQPKTTAATSHRSAPPALRDASPDAPTPEVVGELTSCPSCGSTNRTGYSNRVELPHVGEHNGKPFNVIVWRTTQCLDCLQMRRDRHHEHRGPVAD